MTLEYGLFDQLANLVTTVPGVAQIYSPEPVIARAAKAALTAVAATPAQPRRLDVTDSPAGVRVVVRIGVARGQAAGDVCRAVHDAIASNLTDAGQEIDRITVKVSRII